MQQTNNLKFFYANFYYDFYRTVTLTIPAEDRFEALRKVDYMIENKDRRIPDGYSCWMLTTNNGLWG